MIEEEVSTAEGKKTRRAKLQVNDRCLYSRLIVA
jgi:hypothetical protein